jgi:glycosyltransferase involved in cell wall biosynthesis
LSKVIIALNSAWNLVNFRAGLIRAMISAGYDVVAVAPPDAHVEGLRALGCRYLPLPVDSKGTHPGRDLKLLLRFWLLLRSERPSVYLGYTVKPNVYGSLAAHALGIPVINNVAGLGAVFIRDTWLTGLVKRLYRLALARSAKVFFQNNEDRHLFVQAGLVRPEVTDRLPGSGVDLVRFRLQGTRDKRNCQASFRFLLIARMLWDKGVGEYVEAARLVRRRYPEVEFCLLGFLDVQNPAAIPRAQMDEWVAEGVVSYLGAANDVRPHIAHADCVVLPSYREGVPRTLLEAAAMGRPIITTDAVGCRDVVDDEVNGYLCTPRDPDDLAIKMLQMIELPHEIRQTMSLRSREKVEREFDEQIVIKSYLEAIREITGGERGCMATACKSASSST